MDLDNLQYYGESLFLVYREDLNRLARWLQLRASAQDLTTLLRRFVRGRLRYGPVQRGTLVTDTVREGLVRFWDPSKAWQVGDLAIFPEPVMRDRVRAFTPAIGEVIRMQGNGAMVRIDGRPSPQVFGTASSQQGGSALRHWRRSVEDLVRALPDRSDELSSIDYTLYRFGEAAAANLLSALRQDIRFVTLEGQWFLRSLVVSPSPAQLDGLAYAMLLADRPMTVAELLPLVPPPATSGAAGRFGLSLCLQERPDLFYNVDDGARPRWALSGVPPGDYVARFAAYDPETGDVLCEPGDGLDAATVQRLWALGLLRAVVAR